MRNRLNYAVQWVTSPCGGCDARLAFFNSLRDPITRVIVLSMSHNFHRKYPFRVGASNYTARHPRFGVSMPTDEGGGKQTGADGISARRKWIKALTWSENISACPGWALKATSISDISSERLLGRGKVPANKLLWFRHFSSLQWHFREGKTEKSPRKSPSTENSSPNTMINVFISPLLIAENPKDWSDHALWWPAKNIWLTRTRSTLDQVGLHADALLHFTPMHKNLRVQVNFMVVLVNERISSGV